MYLPYRWFARPIIATMVLALSDSPAWVRILLLAPLAWFLGVVVSGWWPRSAREWRFFGVVAGVFTVLCVVTICVFHYA